MARPHRALHDLFERLLGSRLSWPPAPGRKREQVQVSNARATLTRMAPPLVSRTRKWLIAMVGRPPALRPMVACPTSRQPASSSLSHSARAVPRLTMQSLIAIDDWPLPGLRLNFNA